MRRIIILCFLPMFMFMFIFIFIGCSSGNINKKDSGEKKENKNNIIESSEKIKNIDKVDSKPDKIKEIINSMTLEEKVGQLFIVAFRKDKNNSPIIEINEDIKKQIRKFHLGGIILFSENIDTISQTKKLIADMQRESRIPLFVAVDEEGGIVSRINDSKKMHATRFPNNYIIGSTNDEDIAYEVGKAIGEEIKALGFNMNFAPVADVNSNPDNPVIGNRSFGDNAELVSKMVASEVKGIQNQKISSIIKHFPGHGDTSSDSHTGQVVINHNRNRLEEIEFIPFKKGIDAGVDGIMTAHIQVPKLTGDNLPATFSYKFLTEILRKQFGFDRLIVTDALEMGAVSKFWTSEEASKNAFKAGADILLMPESLEEAYLGVLNGVNTGEIAIDRVNESVYRILKIKLKLDLFQIESIEINAEDVLGSKEHLDVVDEINKILNYN